MTARPSRTGSVRDLMNLTLAERADLGPDRKIVMPDGRTHILGNLVTERVEATGEWVKIKAYSKTTDVWLDLLDVIVVADPPAPRPLLELSTHHLPEALACTRAACTRHPGPGLTGHAGVTAYPLRHGLLLWVPDDPRAHNAERDDVVPAEVVTVQRYARALNCDWIMFDSDGADTDDLPRWEW